MHRLLRSALVAAFLFPSVALAAEFDNALIIILDDLGVDKVGAYAEDVDNPGETRPETATLDLLANAGVRFSDAWATPLCSPTRATLFMGEYPYRTGVGTVIADTSSKKLQTTPPSMMQFASDNGLATGLFGKWHLGKTFRTLAEPGTTVNYQEYPIQVGFDHFAGSIGGELNSYTDWLYTVSELSGSRYTTTATTMTTSATDQTTDDALAWMNDQYAAGSRFLSVVSYNLPHATHVGADRTWSEAAEVCGVTPGTEFENQRAAVECVDDAVRTLLDGTPDLENTLVILVGDNGTVDEVAEGYFADGRGKATVYENGVRVPLFVADGAAVRTALDAADGMPVGSFAISTGIVMPTPASVVDAYATVVDFLGLAPESCEVGVDCARDSISMREAVTGGVTQRSDLWTETYTGSSTGGYYGSAALRSGDVKLVVTVTNASRCRSYEMYNLRIDRWETTDVYGHRLYEAEQVDLMALLAAHEAKMSPAWISTSLCQ